MHFLRGFCQRTLYGGVMLLRKNETTHFNLLSGCSTLDHFEGKKKRKSFEEV